MQLANETIRRVFLPLRLQSTANLREHWSKKHRRQKREREAGALAASQLRAKLPATFWLTRVAPRTLDDDNLVSAFKAVRDGIAEYMGVPDNDPELRFVYGQRKGKPKEYGIEVQSGEAIEVLKDAIDAAWGSGLSRRAHNSENAGSSPAAATK